MTKGQIAQVLQMQGGPAEAGAGRLLEQALAAFEEVGDRRQIAVTKGRIADLLQCQGELAEARRLLEQEVLSGVRGPR